MFRKIRTRRLISSASGVSQMGPTVAIPAQTSAL